MRSRNIVMDKRNGQGGIGDTWTITELAYKKKIIDQQCPFHGSGRNGIGFKNKGSDKCGCNNGKYGGIHPFAPAWFTVPFSTFRTYVMDLWTITKIEKIEGGKERSKRMLP